MAKPFDLIRRDIPLDAAVRPPQAEKPRMIDFTPWAFPPVTSIPIDVVDVQTVNFGVTVTINIANTGTSKAVIRFFGNESTAAAGYTDLRWTILLNGVPEQPYVNMRESRGLLSNPDPILIPIPQSTLIQVAVQNTSGVNNWEAKTRLKGWIF